jgi:hypothetical protein
MSIRKYHQNKCIIPGLLVMDGPTLGIRVRHNQYDWVELEKTREMIRQKRSSATIMVYKMWGKRRAVSRSSDLYYS